MNNFISIDMLQYSIESLANKIKLKFNSGGHELPIGTIVEYAGATAPAGYRICDGSALLVADYPLLFDVIGYTYGGADDVFNLPNFKGKSPIGYNMNDTDFDALGKVGGEKTHTLFINEMPIHSHDASTRNTIKRLTSFGDSFNSKNIPSGSTGYFMWATYAQYSYSNSSTTIFSDSVAPGSHITASKGGVDVRGVLVNAANSDVIVENAGTSDAHNNLGPYLVVNYIIKVTADEGAGLGEVVAELLEGKADVDHVHDEYITEHQDISHLATKEEIANIDLSGYATESFVTNKIAEAQLGGGGGSGADAGTIDLSGYATKDDLADYATEEYVDAEISSLVGSSPESLNTLEKISEALAANDGALEVLLELLSGKADIEAVKAMMSPVGSITQFAGTLAPTDYMICDGSSLAKADYPELFDVIGYTYGGEGSMFSLPNLEGRVPVGFKAYDQTFGEIGSEGGEQAHTLTREEMYMHDHMYNATHSHTFTGTSHSHSIGSSYAGSSNYFLTSASQWETDNGDNVGGGGDSYPKQDGGSSVYSTTTNHNHSCGSTTATGTVGEESIVGFTNYTGESRPHNNLQPYIVMNYIIKVK